MNWISVTAWANKYGINRRQVYRMIKKNVINHRKVKVERVQVQDQPYAK